MKIYNRITKKLIIEVHRNKDLIYDLSNADLSYANIKDLDLSDSNISGTNFEDADMRSCNISYCDMQNACLVSADMRHCNMENTDFRGADFDGSKIKGIYAFKEDIEYLEYLGAILE